MRKKTKKIIIATDLWHPEINGVVRATDGLVKFLKNNDFDVTVIHPDLFFNISHLFPNDPNVRLSFPKKKLVSKIIGEKKPDYIHIVTEGPVGKAARDVCIQKKLKFTTAYHGNVPHYIEYYTKIRVKFIIKIFYFFYRNFHSNSSAVIVSTPSLKKDLVSYGFKNVVVCPLGIDTDFFKKNENSQIKEQHRLKNPVFVYFGRVAKEKNVEEYLKLNLPGIKLVIGDGPIKHKLEKKYKGKALFLGIKKDEELIDWLSVADVFVFPSRTETFGLVVAEALACGIPVAAHNVMGPKDIITNGVDGVLGEDLEKAALDCLKIPRENCRKKSLKFSWNSAAECFINSLVHV